MIKQKGYNTQSLASALGIHPSTLSRKITGRSNFTLKEWDVLCKTLALDKGQINFILEE